MPKESGLYSSLGGLSPGPVLGFSVNPRTVQNMKTDMANTQNDHVTKQLQYVNAAVCTCTRHSIDIKYIHAPIHVDSRHVPTDLQKTKIAHMAPLC